MNTIDELIELNERLSISENRVQPKDSGTLLSAIQEVHKLRHRASSQDEVIISLQSLLKRTEDAYGLCQSEIRRLDEELRKKAVMDDLFSKHKQG